MPRGRRILREHAWIEVTARARRGRRRPCDLGESEITKAKESAHLCHRSNSGHVAELEWEGMRLAAGFKTRTNRC